MTNNFIAVVLDKDGEVMVGASCAHQAEPEIRQFTNGQMNEVYLLELVGNDVKVLEHRPRVVVAEPPPPPEPAPRLKSVEGQRKPTNAFSC